MRNPTHATIGAFAVMAILSMLQANAPAGDASEDELLAQEARVAFERMHSDSASVRRAAVVKLAANGVRILPHLRDSLEGGDDTRRDGAVQAIAQIGSDAIPLISAWCRSGTPRLREAVLRAVGRMMPPVSVDSILAVYDASHREMDTRPLFEALWTRRATEARSCDRITALMRDAQGARRRAMAALALLAQCDDVSGGDAALATVIRYSREQPRDRNEVFDQLWRSEVAFGPQTRAALYEVLAEGGGGQMVRWTRDLATLDVVSGSAIAAALIARRTPADSCASMVLLATPEDAHWLSAILRWRCAAGRTSFPLESRALRSSSRDVRVVAADVLRGAAELDDAQIRETLMVLLGDRDGLVRMAAVGDEPPGPRLMAFASERMLAPNMDFFEIDGLLRLLARSSAAVLETLDERLERAGLDERARWLRAAVEQAASDR